MEQLGAPRLRSRRATVAPRLRCAIGAFGARSAPSARDPGIGGTPARPAFCPSKSGIRKEKSNCRKVTRNRPWAFVLDVQQDCIRLVQNGDQIHLRVSHQKRPRRVSIRKMSHDIQGIPCWPHRPLPYLRPQAASGRRRSTPSPVKRCRTARPSPIACQTSPPQSTPAWPRMSRALTSRATCSRA